MQISFVYFQCYVNILIIDQINLYSLTCNNYTPYPYLLLPPYPIHSISTLSTPSLIPLLIPSSCIALLFLPSLFPLNPSSHSVLSHCPLVCPLSLSSKLSSISLLPSHPSQSLRSLTPLYNHRVF